MCSYVPEKKTKNNTFLKIEPLLYKNAFDTKSVTSVKAFFTSVETT